MSKERNSTIDFIKGISILLVVITHYAWTEQQRLNPLFPYIIDMAVPIFMFISGYVGAISLKRHKVNSFTDAYAMSELVRKIIRYSNPFMIAVMWQLVDPNVVISASSLGGYLSWVLNGTTGQGSYYYPILIQLVFIFPILFFIIERKGKKGLWICLGINAIYELLKWSYGMNDECYRLLVFRYIFVIAAGVFESKYSFGRVISIFFTVIGIVFISMTAYGIYTPHIITSWTSTCFIAVMWIVPFIAWIIKNVDISFRPIELIGEASYNIFFAQMIYYRAYRIKLVNIFGQGGFEMVAGMIICIVVGCIFYIVESRITKRIVAISSERLVH